MKFMLFFFIIAAIISSCSSSLVYSPALNLTDKKLKEKEVEVNGSFSFLPETRPQLGNKVTFGGQFSLGYGFTNNFNLTVSGWTDFQQNEYDVFRGGSSIQSRITLEESGSSRIEFIPRAALLSDGNSIEGSGITLPFIYINNLNSNLYYYLGLAPTFGLREFEDSQLGFGVIGHIGLGYNLTNSFRITAELNPIYARNAYDKRNDYLLSPTLTIGYCFR